MDKLCDYGVYNYDIISANSRKGRYCIRFCNRDLEKTSLWLNAPENEECMIKWNRLEKERDYKILMKEIEIYECMSGDNITPKLFCKTPYFVIKYERDCKTLRNFILDAGSEKDFEVVIHEVLNKYIRMLERLNNCSELEVESLPSFSKQIKRYYSKLLLSGPEGTKDNKVRKILNKIYKYLFWKANKIDEKDFSTKNYIIHGDFHLNNELVNSSGDVFLIDFENVVRGNPNVELAYWYTQVWMLVANKKKHLEILNKEVDLVHRAQFFERKTFWCIVDLFKKAIIRNSRFQR